MEIVERATGAMKPVLVTRVEKKDLKLLTKKRYFFNWKSLFTTHDLYKLMIEGEDDILGIMALEDDSFDNRIEIKLLASSSENVGASKQYDLVAECMIAFACGEANKAYAEKACVSLLPKTVLKQHHIDRYSMLEGGCHVFLEGKKLNDMIKKHLI